MMIRTSYQSNQYLKLILCMLAWLPNIYCMQVPQSIPIEGPISYLKTTLSTAKQELAVKTEILAPCAILAPLIEDGRESIPLPEIPEYELVHVAACLQAHHNLTAACAQNKGKDAIRAAEEHLSVQTNTVQALETVLMAAHYLEHYPLLAWCQKKWTVKKYPTNQASTLRTEVGIEIAHEILQRTPFPDDIARWTAQRQWLNPTRKLQNPRGSIWCVAPNHAGTHIAIGDWLGNLQIYSPNAPDPILEIPAHHAAICTISFTDDDNQVMTCARDGTIRFWNLTTRQQSNITLVAHPQSPFVFKAHSSTQRFAYDEGHNIRICDLGTNTQKVLVGHTNNITDIAFNFDATLLASGGNDCTLKLWNVTTGACVASLISHNKAILCVQFSLDGSLLASGSEDKTITIHNVATQELIATLIGHTNSIWSVIISPDNQFLYSGSQDGSLKVWHLPTRSLIKNLVPRHRSNIHSMAMHPNGELITVSKSGDVTFWDIPSLTSPILALQRYMARNSTVNEALLIDDAYSAPQREPLDCSTKRERIEAFESLIPEVQALLVKHLHVKPPKKKQKAEDDAPRRSPSHAVPTNKQPHHKGSRYNRK